MNVILIPARIEPAVQMLLTPMNVNVPQDTKENCVLMVSMLIDYFVIIAPYIFTDSFLCTSYYNLLWDCEVHNVIEKVHVIYCIKQLGVGHRTNATAFRQECGQHKINTCLLKRIKYWTQILQMPESCLVKAMQYWCDKLG